MKLTLIKMKLTTNFYILAVFFAAVIVFVFFTNSITEVNHYDRLFVRNMVFFVIGIYFFVYFGGGAKLGLEDAIPTKNPATVRIDLFFDDFKKAIAQYPAILILLTYIFTNFIILSDSNFSLLHILYDTSLIGLQFLFFVWLVVSIKNISFKNPVNLILIMVLFINFLNLLGNVLNDNIYFLLNPFGGWIYSLNFISEELWVIKIGALVVLGLFVGFLIRYSVRNSITLEV